MISAYWGLRPLAILVNFSWSNLKDSSHIPTRSISSLSLDAQLRYWNHLFFIYLSFFDVKYNQYFITMIIIPKYLRFNWAFGYFNDKGSFKNYQNALFELFLWTYGLATLQNFYWSQYTFLVDQIRLVNFNLWSSSVIFSLECYI